MNVQWSEEFNCPIVNGVLAPVPITTIPFEEPRKRRAEGDEEIFFKLFKFPVVGEQYVLERHEVPIGNVSQWYLVFYHNENNWKLKMNDFDIKNHGYDQILEDPNPLLFHKKYELPLQQRFIGWTLEKRQRSTSKNERFYYHQGRQFRSVVETATFILYSTKLNELTLVNPPQQTPDS